MPRRRQTGSAIVFALMSIILVGALATATFNRTTFTEQRSGTARQKDRAELAADASLQMAIRAVQRTGSSSTDESGPNSASTSSDDKCSPLDGPVHAAGPQQCMPTADEPQKKPLEASTKGYVNGINSSDGMYSYVVRGGGSPDNAGTRNVDERLVREITAYGYYNGKQARRTLRFLIVPRAFKFGIYSGLRNATGIEVADGGRMLLPPVYAKRTARPRGSDISANGNIVFQNGARANVRSINSGLYDQYFVDNGVTPNSDPSTYFNGAPWGDIFRVSGATIAYNGYTSGGTNPETRDPDFPTSDGRVNFDGNTVVTQFSDVPSYQTDDATTSTPLGYFRDLAADNGNNAAVNGVVGATPTSSVYTVSEFQALMAQPSPIKFEGLVYVDNKNAVGPCTINITANQVTINNGGLIVRGCDVVVGAQSQLVVTHVVRTAGSPTHRLPGLMVLRSNGIGGATFGGDLTVRTTKTSGGAPLFTQIQGVVYTDRNLLVAPQEDMLDDSRANFNVNGAVVTQGSFRLAPSGGAGTGSALVRWNPLAQRMVFSTAEGEMGTYSIRTADRPPPNIPQVSIDDSSKPVNPATNTFANFTWSTVGQADTVECQLVGYGRSSADQEYKSCALPTNPANVGESFAKYEGLVPYNTYTFNVKVCNTSGCDVDSYSWQLNPVLPTVSITSMPPNPQTGTSHVASGSAFAWTTTSGVDSMTCSIDGGTAVNCGTINDHTPSNMNRTYNGLTRNTNHTFVVKVCNPSGCDQKSYTWFIQALPPTLSWVSKPAAPTTNVSDTSRNQAFSWSLGADAPTAVECKLDSGAWFNCNSSTSHSMSITMCADHTFSVRATNSGGSNSISTTWHNNCRQASVSITSTPGTNAYAEGTTYYTTSGGNGACTGQTTWTGGNVYPHTCSSWAMGGKPGGYHTFTVCTWNPDYSHQACATGGWERRFNKQEVLNGNFDTEGCCWSRMYPVQYGWSGNWNNSLGFGGNYSAPNSVHIQSYNNGNESTWAVIGHDGWTNRGDSMHFIGRPQEYGGPLGYGRFDLDYWNGGGWTYYSGSDSNVTNRNTWTGYCVNSQGALNYHIRYTIRGTTYDNGYNAYGYAGAGYIFDNVSSTEGFQPNYQIC